MKSYRSEELDARDRLGHEFDGLRFLKEFGIGSALPAALAVDRAAGCALYEWIEGVAATDHGASDIEAVLNLLSALHHARESDGAAGLPPATEAVLRLSDLVEQIDRRLVRLTAIAASEPELAGFLQSELQPELERKVARLAGNDTKALLAPEQRTLSPSDFGFHNALRRPDGSLCFIDFEYFGWDDPVKLAADFLWHPAMQLNSSERLPFLDGVARLYENDPTFLPRLAICFPLYGIRWALIVLNEFVPQVWARRSFSGKGGDWEAAKAAQLRKARTTLAALRSYREGQFT